MDKVPNDLKLGGWAGLALVHVLCCGALLLFATGALGGVGAWLLDGRLIWLVLATAGGAAGLFLWIRRKPRGASSNEALRQPETKGLP